jgi:hypothetical protein
VVTFLHRIESLHAGLVAATAGIGWLSGVLGAGSVLFGGLLMAGNVWIFKRLFGFMVRRPERTHLAIALLFVKLPALLALLWLAARARVVAVDGLAVAVGISCFPVAAVAIALTHQGHAEG